MPAANRPRLAPVLTAFAVLAVGATALPLLPVWLHKDAPSPAHSPAGAAAPAAANEIVVDLRDDASAEDIRDIEARLGIDLEFNSIHARDDKLLRAPVPAGTDALRLLESLRKDPRVETAEPELRLTLPEPVESEAPGVAAPAPPAPRAASDRFVPNDPRYGEQWNLRMIGAEEAWTRTRGKKIVVAVIDTGVAARDSARGKRARDFGETAFAKGYDFVHDDDDPYDDHGHGTHVAGTVAESTNNREGVAGLAFEATVLPLKVLGVDGSGYSADIADAIRYAADHGASVINLSLGSAMPSEIIHNAVKYAAKKKVVIVCAAGNGFREGVGYPAAFPECIAVSSVGPRGDLAFYSSWGKQVALAAPGGDMQSGGPAGGILQNTIWPEAQGGRGDDYYPFQGTSMASPHVAAAAALVMAQGVNDPAKVRDLLLRTAAPKADKKKYGAGILSVAKATEAAADQQAGARNKGWLFAGLAGLALLLGFRQPFALRLGVIGALGVGLFGPDAVGAFVGANSAWNLLAFSALAPFLLFWEMEDRRGSRLVASLGLGIAAGMVWSLLTGALPFTPTVFGDRAVAWTVANAGAALGIAICALLRRRRA